jgi:multidrug efflux pump
MVEAYRNSLAGFMQKRWLAFPIIALAITLIFLFGKILPQELAPMEDRSRLRMSITAPEGATFEYTDRYMDNLVGLLKENVPERDEIISITAGGGGIVNTGFMIISLTERGQRERSQQMIADDLSRRVKQLTGARTFVSQEQTISVGSGGARFGLPVQYVIQAPNFEKLREALPKFLDEASSRAEFDVIDVNLKFNKPELVIEIDRDRARALGVSVMDIAQTLQLGLSGQRFGYFIMNGKQYQVIGQMARQHRDEPLDLKSLYVRNRQGEPIQLDNLVKFSEQATPPQFYRYNRYISATVSAGLASGYTVGDGIKVMDEIAGNVLDETFSTNLAGASRDFAESSSSLLFMFVLALTLIYLVLAAQFESFRDPFIIMFTVPLAIAGALFSLWYFNQSLNIFSQIGQIMLIGLVTKNGILIVEFANHRKAKGLSIIEAVKDAAVSRFRPILMTSLSTILGIMPIALALGAGSESRVSMGIAVIGGLVFSTVLTLYVIPAVYSYVSKKEAAVLGLSDDYDDENGKLDLARKEAEQDVTHY